MPLSPPQESVRSTGNNPSRLVCKDVVTTSKHAKPRDTSFDSSVQKLEPGLDGRLQPYPEVRAGPADYWTRRLYRRSISSGISSSRRVITRRRYSRKCSGSTPSAFASCATTLSDGTG